MSALPAPGIAQPAEPKPAEARRTPLRAVPNRAHQIAQLPFVLIIAALLGGGMTGVLVLSTTIQTQSSELIALQATEASLRYDEAALVAQVQDLRSTAKLAERAWDLGMRPNPNPAFILLPDGQVVGAPEPVTGNEITGMTPPQAAAASAAVQAAAAQAQAAARAAAEAEAAAEAAASATAGTAEHASTEQPAEQEAP